MSPGAQLFFSILLPPGEGFTNFGPQFAETVFAAELERSVLFAIALSVAAVSLGLVVAYLLPRSRSKDGDSSEGRFAPLLLATAVLVLPLSLLLFKSEVITRTIAVIIVYAVVVLPFCIWHLHDTFIRIPSELEDAARIDGCSTGQVFRHVVLPIIAPSLIVTTVFSLIAAWSLCVLAPALLPIRGPFPLELNASDPATALIATMPVVILFLLLGVYLVRGPRTSA